MSEDRAIGPIGTTARLVVGLAVIVVAVAADGIGWWDMAAVLTVFPLIATAAAVLVNAGYARFAPDTLARARAPWSGQQLAATALVVMIVAGLGTALTFVTPMNRVAIFVFIGLSMLVAAGRGYEARHSLLEPVDRHQTHPSQRSVLSSQRPNAPS